MTIDHLFAFLVFGFVVIYLFSRRVRPKLSTGNGGDSKKGAGGMGGDIRASGADPLGGYDAVSTGDGGSSEDGDGGNGGAIRINRTR